ncbi:hypothetical protein [Pontibacter ruber]|uniref:FHA domain-containing protein n=1 Tax=Pontibacter ruber TaxID=1343895 RepID=A0ABW5CZU5_9BACT|nr:hypothetical protein [Pontibacter ruber]
MDYIAIIISIIALAGAGFAFLRANSTHHILSKRIESLKDKNAYLEERLRRVEGKAGRSNRPAEEPSEPSRRNQPRQEQHEQRQKQRDRQQSQQQERRQQQERQPQQQQERPQQQQDSFQPVQPRRKKENRRRNEPTMETNKYEQIGDEQPVPSRPLNLEIAGGDLLDELEQAASHTQTAPVQAEEPMQGGKKYAIIPEDGVIRQYQLQQQPDSDSYIEVDVPADGSNMTHYRFNLSGNHAFVISQGIDRLENAFDFEKPSNRMVSRVVLQGDGILSRVNNGWRIQEKARIDFR